MHVWEVFRRERAGAPMQHAGSIVAPDDRFAEVYAREQYGRRGESEALWLVPRDSVSEIAEFVVKNGWGLLEMRSVEMSLEDVFLRLTTEEEGAA